MEETGRGPGYLEANYWTGQGSRRAVAPLKKKKKIKVCKSKNNTVHDTLTHAQSTSFL
jgi:hypothetical protein